MNSTHGCSALLRPSKESMEAIQRVASISLVSFNVLSQILEA